MQSVVAENQRNTCGPLFLCPLSRACERCWHPSHPSRHPSHVTDSHTVNYIGVREVREKCTF